MRVCLFLLFLLSFQHVLAQQSLATSGGNLVGQKAYLSFTVGEVFYENKGNSKDGIQQGFIVHRISAYTSLQLSVYPNPTADFLYFKVEDINFENLHYAVYNFAGLLLASGSITQANSRISLKDLPSENLIIHCYRNENEQVTYKVIKLN